MKRFLVYLGYLASFIYSPKVSWIVSFVRSLVYSGWKKRQFRRMEGFINFPIGTGGEKCISIGKGLSVNMLLLQLGQNIRCKERTVKLILRL